MNDGDKWGIQSKLRDHLFYQSICECHGLNCLKPSYLLVSAQIIGFISAALSGPDSVVGSFSEKQLVMEPSLHTRQKVVALETSIEN